MHTKEKRPITAGAQGKYCKVASLAQSGGTDPKLPPGTNYCLCSSCGRYFGGVNGFERHRISFKCVDPVHVGLSLNEHGYWVRKTPRIARIQGGKAILDDIAAQSVASTNRERL
ncbi:MAG: hypothetical protein ACREHG_07585 [Candidatus Saccharimonadales bacterium]